jgi:hypothetical protein
MNRATHGPQRQENPMPEAHPQRRPAWLAAAPRHAGLAIAPALVPARAAAAAGGDRCHRQWRRAHRLRQTQHRAAHQPHRRHQQRPGGDLMLREKSSPAPPSTTSPRRFTQGAGDASDPEVSYDGKRIVFSHALPGQQHRHGGRHGPRRKGLHRALEPLGIRRSAAPGSQPGPRQLQAPDRQQPATTTWTRSTCRPTAASSSAATGRPSRA